MWLDYSAEQLAAGQPALASLFDPAGWAQQFESWWRQMPLGDPEVQKRLWDDGLKLWQMVLGQYGIGPAAQQGDAERKLPFEDRRFADPRWREQPVFALIHQTYLMLADQLRTLAEHTPGLDPQRAAQLRFTTQAIVDALSPANFPLTNPVVLERTLESKGRTWSRAWSI
jgi:polyhydroxyalkanoate synthase